MPPRHSHLRPIGRILDEYLADLGAKAVTEIPPGTVDPCPACGEPLGGRYRHNGQLVCWPCLGLKQAAPPLGPRPESQRFRLAIVDALRALDRDRFVYIEEDLVAGACPACETGYVGVFFHGRAARADITCSLGCPEERSSEPFAGGLVNDDRYRRLA